MVPENQVSTNLSSSDDRGLSDAQMKEFFKAAGQKAIDMKEANMCFTLSDADGTVFAKDKIDSSIALYYKTAAAKARALIAANGRTDALVAPSDPFGYLALLFYKFPLTILCGKDFYIRGCVKLECNSSTEKSNSTTVYASSSGSLDANKDLLCVHEGLSKIGFEEGQDGIWRSKL